MGKEIPVFVAAVVIGSFEVSSVSFGALEVPLDVLKPLFENSFLDAQTHKS